MGGDGRYRAARPELVDLFDEFLVNAALPDDEIVIPLEHQPLNPEAEDEVPNQEAVNGIARAKRPREPAWRDLGLAEMLSRAPASTGRDGMDVGDKLRSMRGVPERSTGPPVDNLRFMR